MNKSIIYILYFIYFLLIDVSYANEENQSFRKLCKESSGFEIYEKLRTNEGWLAENRFEAILIAQIDKVGFVRYKEKGESRDLVYNSGDKHNVSSYLVLEKPVDKEPVYNQVLKISPLYKSIERVEFSFISIKENRLMSKYVDFRHTVINQETGRRIRYYCNEHGHHLYSIIDKIFN